MQSTTPPPALGRLYWLCAFITLASSLTSAGFSIAALSSSSDTHLIAMYSASRSIALALTSLLTVGLRSRTGLMAVAFVMTLVQAGDALIGALSHDVGKTVGPAGFALVTAVVLFLLNRTSPSAR